MSPQMKFRQPGQKQAFGKSFQQRFQKRLNKYKQNQKSLGINSCQSQNYNKDQQFKFDSFVASDDQKDKLENNVEKIQLFTQVTPKAQMNLDVNPFDKKSNKVDRDSSCDFENFLKFGEEISDKDS